MTTQVDGALELGGQGVEPRRPRRCAPGAPAMPSPARLARATASGVGRAVDWPTPRCRGRSVATDEGDGAVPVPRSTTTGRWPAGRGQRRAVELGAAPPRPPARSRAAGSAPGRSTSRSRWRNAQWPSTYWIGSPATRRADQVRRGGPRRARWPGSSRPSTSSVALHAAGLLDDPPGLHRRPGRCPPRPAGRPSRPSSSRQETVPLEVRVGRRRPSGGRPVSRPRSAGGPARPGPARR